MPDTMLDRFLLTPPDERFERRVVHLAHPIRHGERELSAVQLEELRGAHVVRAPESIETVRGVLELAGQLSGLPPRALEQLRGRDLGDVLKAAVAQAWPMLDLPEAWRLSWSRRRAAGLPAPDDSEMPNPGDGLELVLEAPVSGPGGVHVTILRFRELTGRIAADLPTTSLPVSKHPDLVAALTVPDEDASQNQVRAWRSTVVESLRGLDLCRALALGQLFFVATRGTPDG